MLDNELLSFKRKAELLHLCDEYRDKWDGCGNVEEIARLATCIEGMRYLADSVAFGWGPRVDFIESFLKDYINGKRVIQQNGYTSELYVECKGAVEIRATTTLFINCNCRVKVPLVTCTVFVVGGHVIFENEDCKELVINEYFTGDEPPLAFVNEHGIKEDIITKSEWIK